MEADANSCTHKQTDTLIDKQRWNMDNCKRISESVTEWIIHKIWQLCSYIKAYQFLNFMKINPQILGYTNSNNNNMNRKLSWTESSTAVEDKHGKMMSWNVLQGISSGEQYHWAVSTIQNIAQQSINKDQTVSLCWLETLRWLRAESSVNK